MKLVHTNQLQRASLGRTFGSIIILGRPIIMPELKSSHLFYKFVTNILPVCHIHALVNRSVSKIWAWSARRDTLNGL
jgi:hypothetical protein